MVQFEPDSGGLGHVIGGIDGPFTRLCVVGFLGRLSYEMARSPLTPLYAQHLGAPTAVIGLLVAAVTLTGILFKSPFGSLADLFGFKRLKVCGMVVKASAPFLYLAVRTWPQLLILRFYHGLSTALYAPAAAANVAKLYQNRRASRLGIYGAMENAGVVLGAVIGAAILAISTFEVAFLVSGALGLLALVAVLPLPREVPTRPSKQDLRTVVSGLSQGLRQIAGDPAILLVSLMEATLYSGVGTLQAYLPVYAVGVHMPIARIGLLFGGQGASILLRLFVGRAADRLGRRPFIVAGVVICALVLVAVPFCTGFGPLLALSVAFGLGTGCVTPATTAMIGDLVKRGDFGAAMGVFGSLWARSAASSAARA